MADTRTRRVEKALATTDFMAAHAVGDNPHPSPDSKFTGAFGDLIFGKIGAALSGTHTGVKIQALEHLNGLVRKDENIAQGLSEGLFEQLLFVLSDPDNDCRTLSSQALISITTCRMGREHAVTGGCIPKVAKLLDDADKRVRANAYHILQNLMEGHRGLQAIIRQGLTKGFIISVAKEEDNTIKCAALDTLCQCLADSEGYIEATEKKVVETLTAELTKTTSSKVRASVCGCINVVAMNRDGKDDCVDAGAVPQIVKLLSDKDEAVRVQASSAMVHITIALSGKEAALAAGALDLLVESASDGVDVVVANSMQAIANLAEHPTARFGELLNQQETTAMLESAAQSSSPLVQRGVQAALAKIKWRPGGRS